MSVFSFPSMALPCYLMKCRQVQAHQGNSGSTSTSTCENPRTLSLLLRRCSLGGSTWPLTCAPRRYVYLCPSSAITLALVISLSLSLDLSFTLNNSIIFLNVFLSLADYKFASPSLLLFFLAPTTQLYVPFLWFLIDSPLSIFVAPSLPFQIYLLV